MSASVSTVTTAHNPEPASKLGLAWYNVGKESFTPPLEISVTGWFWFAVCWTFAPFACAVTLIVCGIFSESVRGDVIQALTLAPLVFALRDRLANMSHFVTHWIHEGGTQKEKTRWYGLFLFLKGHRPSSKERALLGILDVLGIIFLVFYFVTGLWYD